MFTNFMSIAMIIFEDDVIVVKILIQVILET